MVKLAARKRIARIMKELCSIGGISTRIVASIGAFAVMAWLALAPTIATAETASIDAVMELHAKDLLDQLGRGAPKTGAKPRIAIWPYAPDEPLPIPLDQARGLNDRLEHYLQHHAKGRFEFKARRELITVIRELEESGDISEDPVAVAKRHAAADILIEGTITGIGGRISAVYKALRLTGSTGSILATSKQRELPIAIGEPEFGLGQAILQTAREFVERASDMTELHKAGIRYQNTGQQPEFGSYIEQKITDAIVNAFGARGRTIRVKRAQIDPARLDRMRGEKVDRKNLIPRNFDPRDGVYTLTGEYWVLGKGVDLRLRLRDARGATIPVEKRIIKASIDGLGLRLHPRTELEFLRENLLHGSVRLTLSSDRGKDPLYKVGEPLNLLIEVSRKAWLYCFYLQSDKKLLKIYPNDHHKPAALAARRLHTIPGRMFPFDFKVTKPIGAELVKCFATRRNVIAELPRALRNRKVAPLPNGTARRLREVFGRLRGAEVTEASLVITVDG